MLFAQKKQKIFMFHLHAMFPIVKSLLYQVSEVKKTKIKNTQFSMFDKNTVIEKLEKQLFLHNSQPFFWISRRSMWNRNK
jgi:hypothetical protein